MSEERYLGTWQRMHIQRRRLIRSLAIAAAGGSAIGLTGCSSKRAPSAGPGSAQAPAQQTGGAPQPGGVLNVIAKYNPTSLDPHLSSGGSERSFQSAAMSRPLRFKSGPDPKVAADHDVEPDLALSAESPDAITWTLKLRRGATFHDLPPVNGHAVEAEDIKTTYTRFLAIPGNPNRGALGMIDPTQIEVPASDTVVFRLKYPYAPFRSMLASPVYSWILPREAAGGGYDPAKQLIGSGPFLLDTATPDVAYTFKKNSSWYQKGQPNIDGLRFAIIPTTAQQLAQFTSGNLDEASAGINDLDTTKRTNPKASVLSISANNPNPIYMQLGDPASPFQDVRLRRALSMALDRQALGKTAFGGQFDTYVFVPPTLGKWALSASDLDANTAQYFKYNPPEAKKLLEAAGASNLALKFAFVANGPFDEAYRSFYQTIGNMLQAVGLKITLVDQDYRKDFIAGGHGSRQGFFDKDLILFGGVAQYTGADEYLFNYFGSKSTSNQERLSDPDYDAMLAKARTIVDAGEQLKAYRGVQTYLAEKMLVVTTASGYSYTFVQPWVHSYDPSGSYGVATETYAKLWLKK